MLVCPTPAEKTSHENIPKNPFTHEINCSAVPVPRRCRRRHGDVGNGRRARNGEALHALPGRRDIGRARQGALSRDRRFRRFLGGRHQRETGPCLRKERSDVVGGMVTSATAGAQETAKPYTLFLGAEISVGKSV